ncbi:hypothetical protein ACIBO1_19965, partial [Micromonospora sp. NPDC049903]|uniref:hypothetical protein n=1 Tax=Micromonospora sp. NPDC049903 TaxID=3364276 RepID=UPI0037A6DBD8
PKITSSWTCSNTHHHPTVKTSWPADSGWNYFMDVAVSLPAEAATSMKVWSGTGGDHVSARLARGAG